MTEAPSFEFDVISEDDGFWLELGDPAHIVYDRLLNR
jgi:hypothetical protein